MRGEVVKFGSCGCSSSRTSACGICALLRHLGGPGVAIGGSLISAAFFTSTVVTILLRRLRPGVYNVCVPSGTWPEGGVHSGQATAFDDHYHLIAA